MNEDNEQPLLELDDLNQVNSSEHSSSLIRNNNNASSLKSIYIFIKWVIDKSCIGE
jgi:hypothetical protein